jgi:hypothetical protein
MADQPQDIIDGKPLSAEAKKRIHEALKKTLEEELAKELQTLGVDGAKLAIDGPWSALASERDALSAQASLSPELYAQIRGQFNDNIVREILLAAAGVKVSRTCLSDAKLAYLHEVADQYGFCLATSSVRYILCPDTGKGGFCNDIARVAGLEEKSGWLNVYIASDASLAEAGKLLEEAGDDELFGLLLGIPPCCREAYARLQPVARAKQNDLVPLALDNTPDTMPYDPWLNYLANYFGRALLSFFPCSFRCQVASAAAKSTFEMLAECDEAWARSFLDLQRTNILYTEYQGLHLFRRPFVDGSIHYGPDDFDSTEPTEVAELIRRGDRLDVRGKRQVDIYRGEELIGVLEGEDIGMCVFW